MTTGLERRAHRLVELARAGDEPSATQLLSLHGAVAARIAAEGASATAGATAAAAKVSGVSALVKGLVVVGAVATGAASFFLLQGEASAPVPAPAVTQVTRARAPAPPPPLQRAEPLPPEPVLVVPPPSRPSKAPTNGLRLQDEAALLAEVQSALRSGQPQLALGKLEAYDRRFPGGGLRAEADAAKVFALCASGRVERARASAERFVKRYPRSPAIARVQAACK